MTITPERLPKLKDFPVTPTTLARRPMHSLLASAKRLTSVSRNSGNKGSAASEWQEDAWDMYDLVGEQHFLSTTLAGRLAQAKIFVGQVTAGEDAPEPLDDGVAVDLLSHVGGSASGLAQLLYRLDVNLRNPGEGWLVGVPSPEDFYSEGWVGPNPAELEWHMLSISEVAKNIDGKIELDIDWGDGDHPANKTTSGRVEFSPMDIYLIRIWRPHPRKWREADSPTRASLPVLKELVGLTMHISAQVDSRLAGAGLLIVPQSAQQALKAIQGDDSNDEADPFTSALVEAMMTPISDRASASAVVPLVITVPDDSVSKFQHMTFDKPLDTEARSLRDEAIRRLALSQDCPPELLLGTSSMNHWGGWLVKEETVSNHIEPTLALICDALTTQYLRPALVDGGMSEEDADTYVVWYDVSHLISRPDHAADAMTLHERGVVSDDAVRRITGFDDTDAPTESVESRTSKVVLQMIQESPSLIENPGIEALVATITPLMEKSSEETQTKLTPVDGVDEPRSRRRNGGERTVPELEGME